MITSKDGKRQITAEEFDEMFDNGEDVSEFLDFEHARMTEPTPGESAADGRVTLTKKVNLDLPLEMVEQIDLQASRSGSTRQGLLRQWIWERLREEQERDLRLGVSAVRQVAYT